MLPFLKFQKEGSVADSEDESERRKPDDTEEFNSLEVAMKELFSAKDDKARAAAFKAAFQILESEPHEEGPHE